MFQLFYKVFIFMFLGFVIQIIFKQNILKKIISKTIDFNIYIFIPFFILLNLWIYSKALIIQRPQVLNQLIIIVSVFTIAGIILSKIYSLIYKIPFNEISHTITFMNSLYLGLPVVQFFIGPGYSTFGIIAGVLLGVIQFTIGIRYFLGQKQILSNLIGFPSVFAMTMGLIFSFLEIKTPNEILFLSDVLKKIISPFMLVIVGYRLPIKTRIINGQIISSILFRLIGGFLVGVLTSEIFGFEKDIYCFTVLISSMPSAVNNYIIQEKFKINPEFAAENVFWGTLLSVIFIPLVGLYLKFSGVLNN